MEEKTYFLEKGKESIANRDPVGFDRLTKSFRKKKQKWRRKKVIEALDKDLDVRDKWLGIRNLKHIYRGH